MEGFPSRFAKTLLAAALVLMVATCSDSPISSPPGFGPSFAVSDGATGGNEDVFFLPPLVSSPTGPKVGDRPANPDLAPFAKVCTLDATESTPLQNPACVDAPGSVANLAMTFDESAGFYSVNWQTGNANLDPSVMYRIGIFIGAVELAFRDVDPDPGPPQGACTTQDDFCQFNNGSNLAIKVIIESFAGCIALDPTFDPNDPNATCATATLGEGDFLALQMNGENIGVAGVDDAGGATATINMQRCPDLRDANARPTAADGLVDIPTFGDCIVIEGLDDPLVVFGTATVCNAFQAALDAGLSEAQAERLTVHRFSTDLGSEGVYALPHSDFDVNCDAPSPVQGAVIDQTTKLQLLARTARRAWSNVADHVRSWFEPPPLWAGMTAVCNRGGCTSSSEFRSEFQVAEPTTMVFHPDNPDGDLGTHNAGDVVTAKVQAFDSGEFEDGSPSAPAPVNNVRLNVAVVQGTGVLSATTIFTGPDGVAEFQITLGPGTNTIEVSGIGVGTNGMVFAPALGDPITEVKLEVGALTFAASGLVPLTFVPDPPTGDKNLDATTGLATLDDFQVCASPPTAGAEITSMMAVKNNGEPVEFGNLTLPQLTDVDGCVTFSGLTINKTGAYRLVVNTDFQSKKFNIRPPKKN